MCDASFYLGETNLVTSNKLLLCFIFDTVTILKSKSFVADGELIAVCVHSSSMSKVGTLPDSTINFTDVSS